MVQGCAADAPPNCSRILGASPRCRKEKKLASHTQHHDDGFPIVCSCATINSFPLSRAVADCHRDHAPDRASLAIAVAAAPSPQASPRLLPLSRMPASHRRAQPFLRQAPVITPADHDFDAPLYDKMQNWTIPPASVPAVPLQPGQHQYLYQNSTVTNGHPGDLQSVPHFLVPFRICPSPAPAQARTHTHTHTHKPRPSPMSFPPTPQNLPPPFMYPMYSSLPGHRPANMGPE